MLLIMCGFSLTCCSQKKPKKSFGIDISHHNGKIDWGIVPSVDFVYIKATEGATYIDPMYNVNLKGARSRKYKVGAYHYFRTSSSATKQFENFKKQVKRTDVDLIPVVDVDLIMELALWFIQLTVSITSIVLLILTVTI